MVIRKPPKPVKTPEQQRRTAQRKLAKQIKEGTFEPSQIGAKERAISTQERERLVRIVNAHKARRWDTRPRYRAKGSNHATRRYIDYPDEDYDTEPRSISDLRAMARSMDLNPTDDFWVLYALQRGQNAHGLYYH